MKILTITAIAFVLAMPAFAQDAPDADMSAGETMYREACAQCHGRAGRGMASFPSITGKDEDYLATRLMEYRDGETVGPNSALMKPVAEALSDEDIANLSAFVSTNFQ